MEKTNKQSHEAARHAKATKHAKKRMSHAVIKPKHAKPYRKRHYAVLLVALAVTFVLFGVAVAVLVRINAGLGDSQNFISDTFNKQQSSTQSVVSTYGFSLNYDTRRLYASAIDGSTGKLYISSELGSSRAYQTVKFSDAVFPSSRTSPDTVTLDYYPGATTKTVEDAENQYITKAATNTVAPTVSTSKSVQIQGITYKRTVWDQGNNGKLGPILSSQFLTYTTLIQGKPLILRTNYQLGTLRNSVDIDAIAASLTTGTPVVSYVAPTKSVGTKIARNRSLLDTVLFASASADSSNDSQTTSALYAPAVVKIYNVYCMDIAVNGQTLLTDACDGVSGSGFFVGSDGYIATNGHVATDSPKDIIIQTAISNAVAGNSGPLMSLLALVGIDKAKYTTITDPAELVDTVVNDLYNLPDSDFVASNAVQNLLVNLDSKEPDVNKLLSMTDARQKFPSSSDTKTAKLVTADYRAVDGINKYHNSDVAIIQIDGSNYPVTSLGSIDEISQGSAISILGFPAAASGNGIVSSTASEVTLTSGKVSSVKNANGDTRKLIETDTTIGHGNSGGPVLDDAGNVVGIATYTVDGSGQGDGTFNYVRDIKDLKTLASKKGITFNTVSKTQDTWQKAIAAFNTSHYSKSIKLFNEVKALYPQHPTVASFIDRANQNIKAGKDVKDFPVAIILVGAAISFIIAGVAVVVIVRHHGKHQVYKVANGQLTPLQPGQQPPAAPAAQQMMPPQAPQPGTFQPMQPMPAQPMPPVPPQTPLQQPPMPPQPSLPSQQPTVIAPQPPTQVPVSQDVVAPSPAMPQAVISPQPPVQPIRPDVSPPQEQ